MKKKIMSFACIVAMLLVSVMPCFATEMKTVSAGKKTLTYVVENDEVTITGCVGTPVLELEIPETVEGYPVTKIADSAFEDCVYITKVKIPDSVKVIGNNAFKNCVEINSVYFGKGLVSIGDYAFCNTDVCEFRLSDHESLESIGEGAFKGCHNFHLVDIPETVKTIGAYAFDDDNATIRLPIFEKPEGWDENWCEAGRVDWGPYTRDSIYVSVECEALDNFQGQGLIRLVLTTRI